MAMYVGTRIIFQNDNAMNVIRHNHKCIQNNTGKVIWQHMPYLINKHTSRVKHYLPISNPTENPLTAFCTDGYIIGTRRAVIVAFLTNGSAMISLGIIGHSLLLSKPGYN